MIKSISAWAFDAKRPLPEVFRIAKKCGFDAVEVAVAEEGPLTPDSTEKECAEIVQQAQESGVRLSSLASGLGWQYPLTSSDAALRQRGVEATAGSLRVAQMLGLDTLLVVPGIVGAEFIEGSQITSYDVAHENLMKSLAELTPVAGECGVAIGLENVWNKFLLSPLEMREVIDALGSSLVGSYFDVGNTLLTGYPDQWIHILGSRIKRVHFKDFKTSVGTLDGFCPLLEGDVDYPVVMQALRDIGYDGFVTAEFFNCEADLPSISQAMTRILAM